MEKINYRQSVSFSKAIEICIEISKLYLKSKPELISLSQAANRVLAKDIQSTINVPPFTNSAMDGYAIKHSELPEKEGWLNLQEPVFAGEAVAQLNERSAIPIMTGSIMPLGADTIVIKEHSNVKDGRVYLREIGEKGAYIRKAGSDIREGKVLFKAHHRLKAQDIGLLASIGCQEVSVHPKANVVLLTGGNEVVQSGKKLKPGQIYDSVQPTLTHLLNDLNCKIVKVETLIDDKKRIESVFDDVETTNTLIVSTGGVSAGDKDFILSLMQQNGLIHFHKTNIKPGYPLLFGEYKNALFFGLPGNPVSSFVTFFQFIIPTLRVLSGENLINTPHRKAKLTENYNKQHYRREFVRARLCYDSREGYEVIISGNQGSGRLSSVTDSNCFIILDETPKEYKAGESVTVQRFVDLLHPHLT